MNYRVAGFILAVVASHSCIADEADSQQEENVLFEMLDTNGDGYISQFEAQQDKDLSSKFATLDKNHDNKLSRDEFKPFALIEPDVNASEGSDTSHRTNTQNKAPHQRRGLPGSLLQ